MGRGLQPRDIFPGSQPSGEKNEFDLRVGLPRVAFGIPKWACIGVGCTSTKSLIRTPSGIHVYVVVVPPPPEILFKADVREVAAKACLSLKGGRGGVGEG